MSQPDGAVLLVAYTWLLRAELSRSGAS